jgi:hypothetical protein
MNPSEFERKKVVEEWLSKFWEDVGRPKTEDREWGHER